MLRIVNFSILKPVPSAPTPLPEPDLFDLIDRDIVRTAVIELCGSRRGMAGDVSGAFDGAAVGELGGDAGGAEGVIADGRGEPCRLAATRHHSPDDALAKRLSGQT